MLHSGTRNLFFFLSGGGRVGGYQAKSLVNMKDLNALACSILMSSFDYYSLLAFSLVFILFYSVFPDHPRFCRPMKSRVEILDILNRLEWTGANLENWKRFYFPTHPTYFRGGRR